MLYPATIAESLLTDYEVYLWREGRYLRAYEKFGAHPHTLNGTAGTQFTVWAPSAKTVAVIGNFNSWNRTTHSLFPRWDGSGIWEGFIPELSIGELYKYYIHSWDDKHLEKSDPFGYFWEVPPQTSTITWKLDYEWNDQDWMKNRFQHNRAAAPMSVYEVHLGSWKKILKERNRSLSYKELAEQLVPYVREMGFTHVEFLPVMEHPYFHSWGYQLTGYFAPTSRFGSPQEFMHLVDAFHQEGIGVLLDWVPSHFPSDAHGLYKFDGSHLFEHEDPRKGWHPDWQSAIYNYGRGEVRSFLISNAIFWLDFFHADGLRVDAVASMLYLDYSRKEGEWIANEHGGRENLEAIRFLQDFNTAVYSEYPDVVTIAEESTSWPLVSRPVSEGGLGFGQKWMMGWMHDTLDYFKKDPYFRKHHQYDLIFSLVYAFSENFMLPLSHDEVVHGKAPLVYKMPGNEEEMFANLRALFGWMWTHPGTRLLFMGGEFAQTTEWSIDRGLDWDLLQHHYHQGVQAWVKTLNNCYKNEPALFELQFQPEGFQWIDYLDFDASTIAYLRKGKDSTPPLLVVLNLTPVTRTQYKVGVPVPGRWVEILNSDAPEFGGSGQMNSGELATVPETWNNCEQCLLITTAPLACMVFKPLDFPEGEQSAKRTGKKSSKA